MTNERAKQSFESALTLRAEAKALSGAAVKPGVDRSVQMFFKPKMTAFARPGASAVALVMGIAALGGCDKKPGGQVVAVVNGEEITQLELRAEAQASNVPVGEDLRALGPGLTARVVERNLLADYARDQGLDRGPDFIARRRQLEQSLLASLAIRKIVGTPPKPTPEQINAYIAGKPSLFAGRARLNLDQIAFPTPPSQTRVAQLLKLGSIDAIQASLASDNIQLRRLAPSLDTGTISPDLTKQITALPKGGLFDFSTGGTTYISTVTGQQALATPSAGWAEAASAVIMREKAAALLKKTLDELKAKSEIEYDPAFKLVQPDVPKAPIPAK